MEAIGKIPRIEDYLSKLSSQLKELNVAEIYQKIKDLQFNKMDKEVFLSVGKKITDIETKMEEFSKMLHLLD